MLIDKEYSNDNYGVLFITKDDIKYFIKASKMCGCVPKLFIKNNLQKLIDFVNNFNECTKLIDNLNSHFKADILELAEFIYKNIVKYAVELKSYSASNDELINLVYKNVNPNPFFAWSLNDRDKITDEEARQEIEVKKIFKVANRIEKINPKAFAGIKIGFTVPNLDKYSQSSDFINDYGIVAYYSDHPGFKNEEKAINKWNKQYNDNIKDVSTLKNKVINKLDEFSHDIYYKLLKKLHDSKDVKNVHLTDVEAENTNKWAYANLIIIELNPGANLENILEFLDNHLAVRADVSLVVNTN